ncbi:ribose-phosphate pyrophosphokinase [Candidatus Gottesmanbacteria bacterium]|nr:ribose-phosphate pyrophosphokinase [Candidatus Gottesmanbacteria bacterium]
MKLFAGSSNIPLSHFIAKKLNTILAKSSLKLFDDGEIKPVIEEDVRDQVCVIIQTTSGNPNNYWMELFLMTDAIKRGASKKIIAIIPNFGYARQNQRHMDGEPVSAHVMVNFLQNVGISEVITVDLHDETMTGMFDIPITNLSALPILAKIVKPYIKSDFTVVTPDQGGIERARLFAESMGCKNPIIAVEKKRELTKEHQSHALQVLGNATGLDVVIQDDVVTSGRTLLNAVNSLAEQNVKNIYACVTHEDFSPGVAHHLQQSQIQKFFVTNTVNIPTGKKFPKLHIVDISSLLAEAIKKVV